MTETPPNDDFSQPSAGLWEGDRGVLREASRRALLELLRGPYLSGRRRPNLWQALLADEYAIRSRLHELFLEVVIDREEEFAFIRKVETEELSVPSALRSESMTFLDTAMLLVLRRHLLSAAGERRAIIGRDELFDQLSIYREGDDAKWAKRMNSSWSKLHRNYSVLHKVDEDRSEISPVLKVIIDAEQAEAFTELYQSIAERHAAAGSEPDGADESAFGDEDEEIAE